MKASGQIFTFSAPSGAGKSTLIARLMKEVSGVTYSVSHTSRRPRDTERNGVDYHFVDREVFERMIREGAFVEWAKVYEDYYGTAHTTLQTLLSAGMDVVLDLDPQGAKNLKARFPESVTLFVLPPSMEVLEERLRRRGTDSEEVILRRMEQAPDMIRCCPEYDYLIINDDLDRAVREARAIVEAERCRTPRRLPWARASFPRVLRALEPRDENPGR